MQGVLQAKLLSLGKVTGTVNCANFLTKHPKSGTEVREALPGLGMYEPPKEEDILSTSKQINQCESIPNQQTANMEDTNPSFCRLDTQAGRRSGKDRHGDARERQGQCHEDLGTPEPDQCCRSPTAGNQHLAAVDPLCTGNNWNYHRVVENVSTWQMDRGLALSS